MTDHRTLARDYAAVLRRRYPDRDAVGIVVGVRSDSGFIVLRVSRAGRKVAEVQWSEAGLLLRAWPVVGQEPVLEHVDDPVEALAGWLGAP